MKRKMFVLLVLLLCITQFIGCLYTDKVIGRDIDDMTGMNMADTLNVETTDSDNANNIPSSIGGSESCIHSILYGGEEIDNSYHSIDSSLILYVGEDRFKDWVAKKKSEKSTDKNIVGCNASFSIVDFVNDFNFPRVIFEALNDNNLRRAYDYNLDVIYGSINDAEAYYSSDRTQKYLEIRAIDLFKGKLYLYVNSQNSNAINEWIDRKNNSDWGFSEATRMHINIFTNINNCSDYFYASPAQYSYAEFIREFRIPRDVVEKIAKDVFDGYPELSIDIDLLYSELTLETLTQTEKGENIDPFIVDSEYIVYKNFDTKNESKLK